METASCIITRASVRSFKPDSVPEEALNAILEAATSAPCAGNIQEWHFVVVRNPGNKKRLSSAAFEQAVISNAPVVVVVCADTEEIGRAYGERGGSLYSVQDAATAAENMMLMAWDMGIGSCWVGSFNEQKVKDILVLPQHVRPMAIIPMGYPASRPQKPERKGMKSVTHREFY